MSAFSEGSLIPMRFGTVNLFLSGFFRSVSDFPGESLCVPAAPDAPSAADATERTLDLRVDCRLLEL